MYFQAIPLFMRDDDAVFAYFRDYRAEIDSSSGDVVVVYPEKVAAGDPKAFDFVFGHPLRKKRYPGLRRLDLPCLWIEDGAGGRAMLRLPNHQDDVKTILRALGDDAPGSSSARQLVRRVRGKIPDMSKRSQQISAYVFGVTFLTVILVMAVAFPEPTPFQYTVFRIVLAMAVAGVAAMIPGFLTVEFSAWLRAGGALGVFAVVYYTNPAGWVVPEGSETRLVHGYVRDAISFSPLGGSEVSMSDPAMKSPAKSDDAGYFAFPGQNVKAGKSVEVTSKRAGYGDYAQTLTIGDKPLELLMRRAGVTVTHSSSKRPGQAAKQRAGWPKPLVIDAAGAALDRSRSSANLKLDKELGIANGDATCKTTFRAVYSIASPFEGIYNLEIEYASGEERPVDLIVNGAPAKTGILRSPTGNAKEGFTNFAPYPLNGIALHQGDNTLEFVRQGNLDPYPGNCTPFLKQFALTLDKKM